VDLSTLTSRIKASKAAPFHSSAMVPIPQGGPACWAAPFFRSMLPSGRAEVFPNTCLLVFPPTQGSCCRACPHATHYFPTFPSRCYRLFPHILTL
jgi:hypothetical protein